MNRLTVDFIVDSLNKREELEEDADDGLRFDSFILAHLDGRNSGREMP